MRPTLTLQNRVDIDKIHKETGYGNRKIAKILGLSRWAVLGHLRGRTNGSGSGNHHPKQGSEHHSWKGDKAGYSAIHIWARKNVPLTDVCQLCGKPGKLDRANLSGEYIRDKYDFICICRSCHADLDGNYNRRDQYGRLRKKDENTEGKTSASVVKQRLEKSC